MRNCARAVYALACEVSKWPLIIGNVVVRERIF